MPFFWENCVTRTATTSWANCRQSHGRRDCKKSSQWSGTLAVRQAIHGTPQERPSAFRTAATTSCCAPDPVYTTLPEGSTTTMNEVAGTS